MIDNDMIHRLTWLLNGGINTVNKKNANKLVETNLKNKSNGRNMRLDMINETSVILIRKIIGYKMNYNPRLNSMLAIFIHATYLMTIKKEKVNMCETLTQELVNNIDRI